MPKNKEKSIMVSSMTPVVVMLLILIPLIFLFLVFAFWLMDRTFLNESRLLVILTTHIKEIIVLWICLWALAFYYVTQSFRFNKPKETKDLASSEWKTISEQKKIFGVAPIDTKQSLSVGGAPINKISETELLYEKDATHDLTLGATRSGKSRKIVRQLVMLASMANESMIFNDPKKEMYQDFHNYLKDKGYDVYCLDLRFPEYSNAWNPLDDIVYMMELGNIDDADQYADDQVTSLVVDNGKTEPIWIDGQKALIKSLILEVTSAPINESKKNYYSVYQTLSILGKETKVDGKDKMLLSVYMDSLEETSPSRVSYTPIAISKDKTTSSFMSSALATLHPFTGLKLMKILSRSDFNFHDFKDGKKALFVVYPDEKKTYDAITAMVYDNAYQSLIFEANRLHGRALKKRVHMILDEFGNMPKISNLESKITVSLSRNVLFHLYMQDFKQMNERYGDNVASIIRGNCNLWYFISSGDFDACEEMSKKIGSKTIQLSSQSGNYNQQAEATSAGISYSQQTRRLMDANELMSTDNRDGHGVIVYRTYLGPCKVELPDCSQYSWYSEMKTDETEVKNEGLVLNYAIPRYIVINREVCSRYGIFYPTQPWEKNNTNINSLKKQEATLHSKEMYWYWATHDNIGATVVSHIMNKLIQEQKTPITFNIQKYMKSEEFITWLWSVDDPKKANKENMDETSKILSENNDNVLEETEDTKLSDMFD